MTPDHAAAAIAEIARETGETPDRVRRLVTQHGPAFALAALDLLRDAEAGGSFKAKDRLAFMFAKCASGDAAAKIDREVQASGPSASHGEFLRLRYYAHQGLDDPIDTAAKRLAGR